MIPVQFKYRRNAGKICKRHGDIRPTIDEADGLSDFKIGPGFWQIVSTFGVDFVHLWHENALHVIIEKRLK